ncbi:IclR family transcriptional regulator [Edaphobacter acidisoli]|uniref:IclR family transcriptional regulator n=1 Tax=Edaphobacter acidisoli TaxID=2040573 RepID=A0A916REQ8_9BACT|nr:IclR family transcriptional regulator [Edaphobacter acidisoli]GGA54955.1 IclR family transcriptional regulator [Edaphobacter acidisoli]
MPAKNHIDLVVKTLNVLESLAQSEHGKALKEVAAEVGLVKSSVFRILFTLKQAGYVEQPEANGVYRLTLKTAGLTRRNSERMGFVTVARPHLTRLRDELDESVALAERRDRSIVLIDVLETSHPLRLTFHIGDHCPIHATAMGKAVAAFLSTREVTALLDKSELPQYTQNTNTRVRDLKADLGRVHKLGYSVNDEETVSGAVVIGAPIFDSKKSVCGALSVNTPTVRCSATKKKRLIAAVIDAGNQISADLSDIGFVR